MTAFWNSFRGTFILAHALAAPVLALALGWALSRRGEPLLMTDLLPAATFAAGYLVGAATLALLWAVDRVSRGSG